MLSPFLCDVMKGDDDSISIDSRNKFKFRRTALLDCVEIAVMSFRRYKIIPKLLVLGLIMKRVQSL